MKEFLVTYGYSTDVAGRLYTDIITANNKKDAVMHVFEYQSEPKYITYVEEL